ncbi:MAG: APC family permease [Rubrobacter sp.]|nr:APC family permease [Rubrobacter sp.]
MPLVRGDSQNTQEHLAGRIRNTRKMLTAALIMSVFLTGTSFVTAVLIPAEEFEPGGEANGRALAYLAYEYLGNTFGTAYDISMILILAFAGASAMAELLNIVPRYVMTLDWTRATRPLVLVYTGIAFAITIIFKANVDAQGGAYATGILAMMTSAALAVTLVASRRGSKGGVFTFWLVTIVFVYATVANVIERPDGIKIASFFIGAIVITYLVSRVLRTTELRVDRIEIDEAAQKFIARAASEGEEIHIIAHRPGVRDEREYASKEKEQREDNHVPANEPILFLQRCSRRLTPKPVAAVS